MTGTTTSAPLPGDALPGRVPVVIVGGGPVGCALGVELSVQGIECLVVERETDIPASPVKAMLLNPRTLEQFRRWGIAETLRAAATTPPAWQRDLVFATSLTGREFGVFRQGFAFRAAEESDRFAESAQVVMQPDTSRVLRERFAELGGVLALGWECVGISQGEEECTVELREVATGRRHLVRSQYVAGCDGPQSTVRTTAGIERSGLGGLSANLLLHWRAPGVLADPRVTPAAFTGIYHPHGNALCVPIDEEHWCAHVAGYPIDVDIDALDVEGIISRIVGPGVEFEVTYQGVYKVHERIADAYRAGRFFLAGDSAHLYAPFGGHNMNSGMGDALNLGWKLAAVLRGWGGDALLDSYGEERRPIAVTNAKEASANVRRFVGTAKEVFGAMDPATLEDPGQEAESRRRAWGDMLWKGTKPQFVSDGIVLDQRYASGVLADDDGSVVPWSSLAYSESTKPGHRAPHAWVAEGQSLYDQMGLGFSLLVQPGHGAAVAPFVAAATELLVPLEVVELADPLASARYECPLTLVRPDQHVAWRGTADADAAAVLSRAVGLAAPNVAPEEASVVVTPKMWQAVTPV